MNKLLELCPVCNNELIVTEQFCGNCATKISGQFELFSSPLSSLSAKQMEFVMTFIRCEGKFNRMEEELGISYPTLKNRFNEILAVLGYDSSNEADAQSAKIERMEILRSLEDGKIEPNEAELRLREL